MGKNDSVLPKGGERSVGGPPARLLGGRGGDSQGRAAPYSHELATGTGICPRGDSRDPRWRETKEVLGGNSPAISPFTP